jgi:hypothetical protein
MSARAGACIQQNKTETGDKLTLFVIVPQPTRMVQVRAAATRAPFGAFGQD